MLDIMWHFERTLCGHSAAESKVFAEFILDHRNTFAMILRQNPVQQRRLSGTKEACEDRHWHSRFPTLQVDLSSAHILTVVST